MPQMLIPVKWLFVHFAPSMNEEREAAQIVHSLQAEMWKKSAV